MPVPAPSAPATIRPATEADLPGVLAIYNEVVRTSAAVYTEQEATIEDRRAWLAQRTGLGYPVLVAADPADGAVLGFATFGDFRPWPGYRHTVEHSVYIRADARGRGLGRSLMAPLLDRAAALGKHVMVAGIDAANPASIRLHETLGFERAGTLREVGIKFGRWLDLVFMQRLLPDAAGDAPPGGIGSGTGAAAGGAAGTTAGASTGTGTVAGAVR